MASRFVSGGTLEKPAERDSEWLKAQQELEDKRRQKEEESKQQDGKSLYQVLQENKAAKQEAFEESAKLKNQFRALNDDEVDFLDAALEATRAKEAALQRETSKQLELFRRKQEQADQAVDGATQAISGATTVSENREVNLQEDSNWSISAKKRKRLKEKEGLKGVKARRTSSANEANPDMEPKLLETEKDLRKMSSTSTQRKDSIQEAAHASTERLPPIAPMPEEQLKKHASRPKESLALVGYGSDEDSD